MRHNFDFRSSQSLNTRRVWRPWGSLMAALLILGFVVAVVMAAPSISSAAEIGIGISVRVGPPPLPVYAQPVCPGPGYIWTPGYWAYDPADGYYWVPGTWVMAPAPGLLWTPGYWGWGGGAFFWHAGYWGPHVGFYGGINYGFGYTGVGYAGGEWRGRTFYYNREVNNFGGRPFANAYSRPINHTFGPSRVSFNGGPGGISARPNSGELAAEHERHIEASGLQRQHEVAAHGNRGQFASVNHGNPGVAATGRPGEFRGGTSAQGGGWKGFSSTRSTPGGTSGNSTRGPNPGGGGTHPVMTTQSHSNYPHASGGPGGGTPHGQSSTPHSEYSHGSTPSSHTEPRPAPAPQHNSRPAEGGKTERHESEPHR